MLEVSDVGQPLDSSRLSFECLSIYRPHMSNHWLTRNPVTRPRVLRASL